MVRDKDLTAPYIYNKDKWVGFDDEISIKLKVTFHHFTYIHLLMFELQSSGKWCTQLPHFIFFFLSFFLCFCFFASLLSLSRSSIRPSMLSWETWVELQFGLQMMTTQQANVATALTLSFRLCALFSPSQLNTLTTLIELSQSMAKDQTGHLHTSMWLKSMVR